MHICVCACARACIIAGSFEAVMYEYVCVCVEVGLAAAVRLVSPEVEKQTYFELS